MRHWLAPDSHHRPSHAVGIAACARAERAVRMAGIGIWQCDLHSEALTWTGGVFDLFGVDFDLHLDRREVLDMYAEHSREAVEQLRADAIARCGGFTLDAEIITGDGSTRWMRLVAEVECEDGRPVALFGTKQDISRDRHQMEVWRRAAERDALTGLAGRALFQRQFLDRARFPSGRPPLGALALVDLDGFKQINDRHGHAAGDLCLRVIGERLLTAFRDAEMVARIGGDEFALLFGTDVPCVHRIAQMRRALPAISAPIWHAGHLLRPGASIGVAAVGDPVNYDAEQLFARADAALYAAKRGGRNRVHVWCPGDC
ncbi:MAG: GGDEF domain-containing protein [Pseudomonadota bacterium]